MPRSEFPGETTECAQVFYYNIYSPFREPADVCSSFEHIELNSFMARSLRISDVRFTNNFQYAINVFWHEENTEPMSNGRLDPGQSMTVSTFVGHIFAANAEQEDGSFAPYTNIIDFVVMDGSNYKFNEHNRLETCEVAPGSKGMFSKVSANPEDVISCDDMHTRLVEFTHQVWHDKRMGLNFVQPQLVRPVTDLGFEIRKLPEETYTWLKTWYDEQQRLAEELEGGAGPCMNQQVAPSAITHLTPEYKDRLSEDLQAMLEEWFGGELSLTSIYGVRKYVNGSVLRMHVDTVNTHVVSAIINVDQDVDQVGSEGVGVGAGTEAEAGTGAEAFNYYYLIIICYLSYIVILFNIYFPSFQMYPHLPSKGLAPSNTGPRGQRAPSDHAEGRHAVVRERQAAARPARHLRRQALRQHLHPLQAHRWVGLQLDVIWEE